MECIPFYYHICKTEAPNMSLYIRHKLYVYYSSHAPETLVKNKNLLPKILQHCELRAFYRYNFQKVSLESKTNIFYIFGRLNNNVFLFFGKLPPIHCICISPSSSLFLKSRSKGRRLNHA